MLDEEIPGPGDWQVRRPGLAPGGWAFEFDNDGYPDIDDTAEVVLALRRTAPGLAGPGGRHPAIGRGLRWITGMQSADGGWGAFDADNTSTLVTKLPFCDFGAVIDPPSADVTAHVVEALAAEGLAGSRAVRRGVVWLLRAQEQDGSWFGRWGANYVYGTGAVVPALIAAGVPAGQAGHPARGALAGRAPEPGRRLGRGHALLRRPRSWPGRARPPRRRPRGRCWRCSPPGRRARPPRPAIRWLVEHQRADGTWDEPQYTGTGFPGDFYINYHLYRLVFPVSALGRYLAAGVMTRPLQAGPRTRPPAVDRSGLLVCAPLRLEARAVRRGLRSGDRPAAGGGHRVRAGRRAARPGRRRCAGGRSARWPSRAPAAGWPPTCGPGDLVVASEVSDGHDGHPVPVGALLAGELRRAGLRVRGRPGRHRGPPGPAGPSGSGWPRPAPSRWTWNRPGWSRRRGGRPLAVVRAISDTPDRPLLSPAALGGGLAALRSLRAAGPALARWAAAAGERQVLLAGPRSFCAGVERAIEIVERALDQHGPPVYVRKQIVHNSHVVAGLEERGAIFVDELSEVPDGARVVFSAHGVSPAVRAEADRRGLTTVDATCPLVAKVHAEARRFAADGYLVALIGHAGHEEVEGTLGEAPDSVALVQTAADVGTLQPADPGKVAYLMQTTLAVDEAADIAERAARAVPGRPARRAATTSATPPPTGSARPAPWRPSPTWCWWPGRPTPPTLCGWWRPRSGRVPPPT